MLNDLLRTLLFATLTSSAAILLVLALRKPMRKLLGVRTSYAVWLLVPFAALVTCLPAPVTSVAMAILPVVVTGVIAAEPTMLPATALWQSSLLLAALWLLGAAAVFALLFLQQRRFVRGLGKLDLIDSGVIKAEAVAGCPALVGAWRPRIVLPADFEQRYSPVERELILAHERMHCRRGDAQINTLIAAWRCIFWFNPLFHIAASRARFDQELACDANVISRFPQSRRAYADAMLKTQLADLGLPVGCYWQSAHPLTERITMLKQPLPGHARALLGLCTAAVLIVGGSYAAWAAQPAAAAKAAPASPGHVAITAAISLRINGGTAHSVVVRSPTGTAFAVADGEDADRWELQGTATSQEGGSIALNTVISHSGKVVSKPTLILKEGESGGVKTDDGAGKTFESGIVVTWSDGDATPKVDRPATEKLSYRSMYPPVYPKAAIDSRQMGKLVLKVQVDENGNARSAEVAQAEPPEAKAAFAESSIAAAMQWKYNPESSNGKPVAGAAMVPIDFMLSDD